MFLRVIMFNCVQIRSEEFGIVYLLTQPSLIARAHLLMLI